MQVELCWTSVIRYVKITSLAVGTATVDARDVGENNCKMTSLSQQHMSNIIPTNHVSSIFSLAH